MNSDRRVEEGILVGQPNAGIKLRRTIAIADRNHCDNSGLACTCDHLLAVGVELLTIEMGVRVDEHRKAGVGRQASGVRANRFMWGQPSWLSAERSSTCYFKRAPIGTSSRKLARTGFPPSKDAA